MSTTSFANFLDFLLPSCCSRWIGQSICLYHPANCVWVGLLPQRRIWGGGLPGLQPPLGLLSKTEITSVEINNAGKLHDQIPLCCKLSKASKSCCKHGNYDCQYIMYTCFHEHTCIFPAPVHGLCTSAVTICLCCISARHFAFVPFNGCCSIGPAKGKKKGKEKLKQSNSPPFSGT